MLEARGQTFTTNEDSFEITGRVAYALRQEGAMLIAKTPEQNGAVVGPHKYSHDSIAFVKGWIDCLRSAGPPDNLNEPVWNPTGRSGALLVAPFDQDAGTVEPPDEPPVDPPPILIPPDDRVGLLLETLAAIVAQNTRIMADVRGLRDDLRQLADIKGLDVRVVVDGLARMEAQLAKGLVGSVFGARITLKPPT